MGLLKRINMRTKIKTHALIEPPVLYAPDSLIFGRVECLLWSSFRSLQSLDNNITSDIDKSIKQ